MKGIEKFAERWDRFTKIPGSVERKDQEAGDDQGEERFTRWHDKNVFFNVREYLPKEKMIRGQTAPDVILNQFLQILDEVIGNDTMAFGIGVDAIGLIEFLDAAHAF